MTREEWMAERLNDAWAVLRAVPADQGEAALTRHGRGALQETEHGLLGTRDSLADDMLEIASTLRPPRE